jgi:hypothetical protein
MKSYPNAVYGRPYASSATLLGAALGLLGGCGLSLPVGTTYVSAEGQAPPGVPANTPVYQIDSNAGAHVPVGSYALTTNGLTWYLGWQPDGTMHNLTGDIYCPAGGYLLNAQWYRQQSGTSDDIIGPNHFHFSAPAVAGLSQTLQFDASKTPVSFDLYIDGQPAINPATAYPSADVLSTTEVMPFSLIPISSD